MLREPRDFRGDFAAASPHANRFALKRYRFDLPALGEVGMRVMLDDTVRSK